MDKLDLLLVGTGEYTTGYIPGREAAPDKQKGIVGLVAFDLRRLHKVDQIYLVGRNGKKFPAIRKHLQTTIGDCYKDMDVTLNGTYPCDNVVDPCAYVFAINDMKPGSGVIICSPDDSHYEIAEYAINAGLHVLITKPPTKTVRDHKKLADLARKFNVHVQVEYHKRFDQMYRDARMKIREAGKFTLFQSYMSQPKSQLQTFKAWAGKSSDISYYLNSHHIDIHCWSLQGLSRPLQVSAFAASGVAEKEGCPIGTEDAITLIVDWENIESSSKGLGVYVACWTASNSCEVHSQQRFSCLCENGEIRIDQAHRGYEFSRDGKYSCLNPLYMKYTPDDLGYFDSQNSYGYQSISSFVDAANALNSKSTNIEELNQSLPTIHNTLKSTAILEAGRKSLESFGVPVTLASVGYED